MKLSVETYEDLIRRSGLVEPAQLERVSAELVAKYRGRSFDSEVLAECLIEQRLITLWQNQVMIEGRFDSLFGGRHAGFFLGNYKLLSHLGSGGMNSVYLAEHTVMRRLVAVKVLPMNSEKDAAFLERFRLESRAIAALDHQNIVRAHDFGNDGDVYYLVMEYVEGKDLHHLVKEKGPLPFSTAGDYVRQAAEGLAHAHKAGLVHRDVKPANLLLDRRKTIKLLDLGVARFDADDQLSGSITRTSEQAILGTADYLAPEQAIDSHNVDARADVYSLGCTLYFFLTGHPPFPRGSLAQRMLMHQMQEPAPIYEDRPNAPAGLVSICQKMMAKKPEDRYCSAEEVSAVLADWLSNLSAQAEEEVQQLKARGVQNSDTHSGLGPSTTMGTTLKNKKKAQAQVRTDERIQCRTCGTIFGRYMYRAKCPKCSTINHPMAEFGAAPYSEYEFGAPATSTGDTDVNMQAGAETQADPSIKASCPGCGATFTARWGKCLVCGMGTILHDHRPQRPPSDGRAPETSDGVRPDAEGMAPPTQQRLLSEASSLWNNMCPPTSLERQKFVESAPLPGIAPVSSVYRPPAGEASAMRTLGEASERTSSSARSAPPAATAAAPASQQQNPLALKITAGLLALAILLSAAVLGAKSYLSAPGVVERFDNGRKHFEGSLVGGKREGPWTSWYESGQKEWQGAYLHDVQSGHWVSWNPVGQAIREGDYLNGKLSGRWTFRYDDGQVHKVGDYHEGSENGLWTFWHPNGQKKSQGMFQQGRRVGEWSEWNIDGELEQVKNYDQPAIAAPAESSTPAEPSTPAESSTPAKSGDAPTNG